MSKREKKLFLLLILIAISAFLFILSPQKLSGYFRNMTAGVFFTESTTTAKLRSEFKNATSTNQKIKLLIVPGHDNEYWGTQFYGVKEADINLFSAENLKSLFDKDSRFEVIISRDENGYNKVLDNYFSTNEQAIRDFIKQKRLIMQNLVKTDSVTVKTDGVYHNVAKVPVQIRLYGINKWANENNIDIVIHLHMNDYPRKNTNKAGFYSGFSIYVPEKQFSNSKASKEIGNNVYKELVKNYTKSTLPKEDSGVIEDQDLIALGSFNTLDPASMLIEYGYIYEDKFIGKDKREKTLSDMNSKIYDGVINFLRGENN